MFASLALCSTARAHHGYAQYDRCAFDTIEGAIESVEWANPHIVMSVKTAETTYRIEWLALQQLQRAGLDSGVLKVGDRLLITGSKNRNPELNVMTLLTEISRPSDGWRWSRPKTEVCATAE
jgi:hypothetical protein